MSKNFDPRLLLERWKKDPVLFCSEALGIDLWEAPPKEIRHAPHGQADILRGYGHKLTSTMSGRKTGKSTGYVCRGIHWMVVKPRPCVIFTAPTYRQVKRPLWEEFNRIYRSAPIKLGGHVAKSPENGWTTARGQMFGLSTDDPDNLRGPSGADQLYLVDEASGFSEQLFEAILGNLMGGGEAAIAFNPTSTAGFAFDSFHSKASSYFRVNLSSLDTPNMTGLGKPNPGMATPADVEEMKRMFGESHPFWQVHVLGLFPSGTINTVVSLLEWQKSTQRWDPDLAPDGDLSIGIDCAMFGDDDSVITLRRGYKVYPQIVAQGLDGHQLANLAIRVAACFRAHGEPVRIKVDNIGIGAACYEVLQYAAKENNFTVMGVGNSESPTSQPAVGPGYNNLGTQTWFAAREWFQEGGAIADEDEQGSVAQFLRENGVDVQFSPKTIAMLQGEITGRTYSFDAQGRYVLEPKKEFKKRIGRSPDRADSLILSIYEPPTLGGVRVTGRRRATGFGGY